MVCVIYFLVGLRLFVFVLWFVVWELSVGVMCVVCVCFLGGCVLGGCVLGVYVCLVFSG